MNVPGGWMANLSNGETVFETNPVPGQKTPWQSLLDRVSTEKYMKDDQEHNLKITSLALRFGNLKIQGMPNCDGFFMAYEVRKKFFRMDEPELHYQGVGSVIGDQVYITWINFRNGQAFIEQEVRPLSSCRIHTTMREVTHGGRNDQTGNK